ncbi:hypothetical protein Glove_476g99 [Diversispora epigaea]|uniref:Protein kinase domain-containing protein n=1 Tax=Diversispora epigaea TaxID=1348612 RepID=A0A397GU59_9GLOM|nr:hypothetical protein Glove_476g99 [Diversispora epigaea]
MSQENNHNSMREWETWMHNLIIEEISHFINIPTLHRKLGINDNILKFYGISKQENTNDYMIILEYTNNGYLRQYLKTNFQKLDWNAKLNLAKRIANVLMYLHSNDIIHGRLNSKNILIHDETIKLNIFGLTKIMSESLRHRKLGINDNILKFYGISKQENTNDYMIILEYTNNGYLRQYLKTNFQKLDWNAKLNLAKRIANVLMYLHSNDIIHGRLNSKNILIHDETIKLNIFGLTKIMSESLRFLTNTIGPIQYIDPQYLENFNTICKNKNSDIFSLGIILWEISSGSSPFEMESSSNIELLDNIVKGKREIIIPGTPPKYNELYTAIKNFYEIIIPETSQSPPHDVKDEIITVKLESPQSQIHVVTNEIISIKFGKTKKQNDEPEIQSDPPFIDFSEIKIRIDHAQELLEVYKKNGQFSDAAKYSHSLGKFKEAAIMLSDNPENEKNIIDSSCYLSHPCRVNILIVTMNNESNLKSYVNYLTMQLIKVKSRSLKKSEKWHRLMEELQLHSAYLKSDLNRRHDDTVVEFRALSIWLKIPPQSCINIEYWHERLQCMMRLCELAYNFIDPNKNRYKINQLNDNDNDDDDDDDDDGDGDDDNDDDYDDEQIEAQDTVIVHPLWECLVSVEIIIDDNNIKKGMIRIRITISEGKY